jgi:hypothetical protein
MDHHSTLCSALSLYSYTPYVEERCRLNEMDLSERILNHLPFSKCSWQNLLAKKLDVCDRIRQQRAVLQPKGENGENQGLTVRCTVGTVGLLRP